MTIEAKKSIGNPGIKLIGIIKKLK
jgi:hypothetical protein